MTRKQFERGLAITVIAATLLASVIATLVTTVSIFYPEFISDLINLF